MVPVVPTGSSLFTPEKALRSHYLPLLLCRPPCWALSRPARFYVPRYDLPEVGSHADRRDVLFWQPLGQNDTDGQARLVFPLSDITKRLRLVVQGITAEGVPMSFTWELPVR